MILGLLVFLIEVIMGIALPFYLTLRTIRKSDSNEDYIRWATYWVLFIAINSFFYFIGIEAAEPFKVLLLAALAFPKLGLPLVVFEQLNANVFS